MALSIWKLKASYTEAAVVSPQDPDQVYPRSASIVLHHPGIMVLVLEYSQGPFVKAQGRSLLKEDLLLLPNIAGICCEAVSPFHCQ